MNGHAHKRDSKCKKCGKFFEICQEAIHGDGATRAWRLCFVPCYCGKDFYPDKANAAIPLAPHEYKPNHPGYIALDDEEEDEDEYEVDEDEPGSESSVQPRSTWSAGHARISSLDS